MCSVFVTVAVQLHLAPVLSLKSCIITTLCLQNNDIGPAASKIISKMLEHNDHLQWLEL
jgi:hypothetical protein